MQLTLAHVGSRPGSRDSLEALTAEFLTRCSILAPAQAQAFRTEEALLEWLSHPSGRRAGRTPAIAVLLDSRGRQFTSESFAAWLGTQRDRGAQHIIFAIGPASGWSATARERANLLFSLGPLTLAHAIARLVLAEQIYRAATILTGHPYHTGH